MHTTLLTITASLPNWTPQVGVVMVLCNLFAFFVGRYAIQQKGQGPNLPAELPGILQGFGVPELLATTSFGHVLGAGMILGLRAAGGL